MMRYLAVVVQSPDRAQAQEINRNVGANIARVPRGLLSDRRERAIRERVSAMVGPVKPVGSLHSVAAVECPDGLPNCRNCGDPAHAETCRDAGHCPNCGTRHGVAPDSVVLANGYELVEFEGPPEDSQAWDGSAKRFVSRPVE